MRPLPANEKAEQFKAAQNGILLFTTSRMSFHEILQKKFPTDFGVQAIVNLLLEKYFMFGEMPMDVVGTLPERAKDFVEDMLYTLEAKRKSALAGVLSKGYPKGDHKGYPRGDKIYNTIDTNIKETQQQPRAGARGGVCVVVVFLLLMVM